MAKQKVIQIADRITVMEKINWQNMLSIRNDDLKQHTEAQLEKLEQSLIHNGFIEPFAAWRDPKTQEIYTINGHTRKKRLLALIEKGYSIPEKLSAFFIDCKNLNDAASVLPLYESKYGNLDASKLDEFKITFDLTQEKVIGSTLEFAFDNIIPVDPDLLIPVDPEYKTQGFIKSIYDHKDKIEGFSIFQITLRDSVHKKLIAKLNEIKKQNNLETILEAFEKLINE